MTLLSSQLGFMIVIRTLRRWYRKSLLSKWASVKIGIGYLAILIWGLMVLEASIGLSILLLMPALALILGERLILYRCRKKLHQSLFPLVQGLVLRMKIGQGFRTAYAESLKQIQDNYSKKKLEELLEAVVFSQQKEIGPEDYLSFLGQWYRELRKVDQQGHLAIERLENLRRKLKIEADFRRRSGQVLAQVHLQGILLGLIYLLLLGFVAIQFGFAAYWKWVSLSGALFLVGGFWLFLLGRRISWSL